MNKFMANNLSLSNGRLEMVYVSPHTKVTFRRVVLTVLTRDGSD